MASHSPDRWAYPETLRETARAGKGHFADFDRYAESGDVAAIESHTMVDETLAHQYSRNLLCFLARRGLTPTRRLLDAGCAIGLIAGALKSQLGPAVDVQGMDMSESAIRVASDRFPDCRFFSGSADDLGEIDDGSLDIVHTREFYPFTRVSDADLHRRFLATFARKLRAGGAVIAVQIIDSLGLADTLDELKASAASMGFSEIDRVVMIPRRIYAHVGNITYHPLIHPFLSLALKLLEAMRPGTVTFFYVFRKATT